MEQDVREYLEEQLKVLEEDLLKTIMKQQNIGVKRTNLEEEIEKVKKLLAVE